MLLFITCLIKISRYQPQSLPERNTCDFAIGYVNRNLYPRMGPSGVMRRPGQAGSLEPKYRKRY